MVSQDQRRRQLAREKFLRQQQRRTSARRKARVRNAVIASVLGVILVGSVALYTTDVLKGDDKKDNVSAEGTPSASPSKAPDPCEKAAAGKVKQLTFKKEPAITIDKTAKYTMDLQTTCGAIGITMDAAKAPHTVNSFDFLVNKGYLDHTKCHRLTTQGIYVLQCGDPKGTGIGGPGYTIPDELTGNESYGPGVLAMANSGPNSGGSQFFIVTGENGHLLDDQAAWTIFGSVIEGLDVAQAIQELEIQDPAAGLSGQQPAQAVYIESVKIRESK